VLVGTSGWQYDDWRPVFYPAGLPQRRWLEYYADRFATVESNNAFYRLPSREGFAAWRERTPDGFVFAVKASRFLTHIKRLRDPQEPVWRLLDHAAGLGDRLGPILLQLPPTLSAQATVLDECLQSFPAEVRVAVEPRHPSWWTTEIRSVLERHGAALCWADRYTRPVTPLWCTAGFGYLRLHAGAAGDPHYQRSALAAWVHRLLEAWPDPADVYIYFNNDQGGAAVRDAASFMNLARAAGASVAGPR
jgi:uncharacterized protein YecE (DUF72 family)